VELQDPISKHYILDLTRGEIAQLQALLMMNISQLNQDLVNPELSRGIDEFRLADLITCKSIFVKVNQAIIASGT